MNEIKNKSIVDLIVGLICITPAIIILVTLILTVLLSSFIIKVLTITFVLCFGGMLIAELYMFGEDKLKQYFRSK